MALDCQSLLVNSTYLQKVMGQALMMTMIWEFNPIPLSLSLSLSLYIYINMGGTEHAGETCGSQSNTFQSFFFCVVGYIATIADCYFDFDRCDDTRFHDDNETFY